MPYTGDAEEIASDSEIGGGGKDVAQLLPGPRESGMGEACGAPPAAG